jgi:Ca2+-binding EF-hand superfamily protein
MIFNRHDADGSGEIEMHEVVSILAENGLAFDDEELDRVFVRFDVDKSGTLDFSEFVEMMADLKVRKHDERD